MKRERITIALAAVLVFLGASVTPADAASQAKNSKKNIAKLTFSAKTVNGDLYSSKELLGNKPSVLWFWAPWCNICVNEAKELVAQVGDYEGKINFVGIGALGNQSELLDFVEHTGASSFTNLDDSSGKIWKRFGVILQPTIIFIDKKKNLKTKIGPSTPEYIKARLKELAASK